ncbi:MAG: hypothetical protein A3G59_03255 [Candidatus Taylorbacteria bacterium RIFCSPLOWO2_12_FULL_47_20]|uniref:ABC transporter domain-containing protein n=2 Tax=Candidatus Tayloriibacteriota TaxID=1817919 RepID=A0A1G2P7L3_9BACT|nr:MAG: hypothetical protein A3H68_01030 [Candidatus Taylorbacteria bacterium RIFCSPLOWO2_02_FULL_46_40]OHA43612.1 MAG: hypothetical protein A3G59_03255 [Candidatus Taylorbacteria bacterium RIFCSPLOWO2_12_FULL_47_20]
MNDSIIKVKNLTKSFKSGESELVVLRNLNFEVPKGQFLSITGRSGSGKSTLLHQIGLLDRPNSGTIEIDGLDVSERSDRERTGFRLNELGFVFQDYALIPELNSVENVAVPLIMQGISKNRAYEMSHEALDRVGLGLKDSNLPSQLSGGEQQRVSTARAIGHKPAIIFADEPTANLDSETADKVLNTFIELHRGGLTIIMVTHEPEYAAMTQRVMKLADGNLTEET